MLSIHYLCVQLLFFLFRRLYGFQETISWYTLANESICFGRPDAIPFFSCSPYRCRLVPPPKTHQKGFALWMVDNVWRPRLDFCLEALILGKKKYTRHC
ncbi:hypothetical protein F5Y17DRAFT_260533 [Xylariaceae sp. FL0594]|nr:hypothetical protein F5Y17DRAFT_260533 [Xylariaceae sp. FL0594]